MSIDYTQRDYWVIVTEDNQATFFLRGPWDDANRIPVFRSEGAASECLFLWGRMFPGNHTVHKCRIVLEPSKEPLL